MLPNNLSRNLKALMWYRGEKQKDLSKIVGVTKQAVSSWVKERTIPVKDMADKIASHYGISAEELMYGNPFKDIEIENLKYIREIFIENGIISPDEEMNEEDYKTAMEFLKHNKDYIFKNK